VSVVFLHFAPSITRASYCDLANKIGYPYAMDTCVYCKLSSLMISSGNWLSVNLLGCLCGIYRKHAMFI
jgi:hypothetical protein